MQSGFGPLHKKIKIGLCKKMYSQGVSYGSAPQAKNFQLTKGRLGAKHILKKSAPLIDNLQPFFNFITVVNG